MAQVNDLLVLGKANFLNEITSSQLLRAFGGIALDDSTAQSTSLQYILGIKPFAEGGNVLWSSISDVANAIRLNASGTWPINISGLAAKATADASGNTITSTYAKLQSANDMVHSSNEWTVVPSGYSGTLWLNYRTCGGTNGNITHYNFGNGKGGTAGVTLVADAFSGNAASANYATSAGSADKAKLLIPTDNTDKVTYGVGTWAANSSGGHIVWREKFVHSSLGGDSGDIVLWLNNATTLNVTIDGYFYQNQSYKVLDTSNVSGSVNYIPKFTAANKIGNSAITDDGSMIVLGRTTRIGSGTVNGKSFYQFDNATYRNPDSHTPELLINCTNSTTGILGYRPGLVVYNGHGAQNATAGVSFAAREEASAGNAVMLSAIVGIKESAGTNNAWSQGGLRFLTKNMGNLTEAMAITAGGYVGIGTNSPGYKLHVTGDIYANGGWVRVSGDSGFFCESHGGGWHMVDSTYIRSYNGKMVYASGRYLSETVPSSWLAGQNANNGAYNVNDYSNDGSYNPWMRAKNTHGSVKKYFSFGTLGKQFYWIGSTTDRTENGYDKGMSFNVESGLLYAPIVNGDRIYTGYDSGVANSVSCSNWFRSNGDTGWYNASYGCHVRPNTISGYGSVRIHGNARNGYEGLHFGSGNNGMTIMSIDGSHQGLYQESTGTWIIYNLNGAIGLGGSGTTSGYKVTTNGSHYITEDLYVAGGDISGANLHGNAKGIYSSGYGDGNFTWCQTSGEFAGNSGWASYLVSNHGNGSNYYHQIIAMPFWGVPKYRRMEGNTSTVKGWYEFITDENYTSKLDGRYVNVTGDSMTGTLSWGGNISSLNLRTGHASYDGVISYQTAGNEAMLFTTKNAVTSFMFVNGEDTITNMASTRWTSLTPGLQIKNNCVSIGRLIGDGASPPYKLDVNGTARFSGMIYMDNGMQWLAPGNITCIANGGNTECSFDVGAGVQWHVWSTPHGASMLSCFADSRNVQVHHTLTVNNRIYADEWIQFAGCTGLYFPGSNCNTLHIMPNQVGSYAPLRIVGSRGGYGGIHFGDNNTGLTVMSSEPHQGLYNESTGRWIVHYKRDSNLISIGNASSRSGYINMGGSTYVEGNLHLNNGGHAGVALYNTSSPNSYGIHMSYTSSYSTHGPVSGDWATYFCFDGANNRGWIFKHAGSNVASINGTGKARFDDTVFGYAYTRSSNKAAFMWDKPGSYYTGVGANGSTDTIQFRACDADGAWVDYRQHWHYYGDLYAYGARFANRGSSTSTSAYGDSAVEIREYNFGGAQSDTWGNAPRLSFHWGGRVAAQIGLASNGNLYLNNNAAASTTFVQIVGMAGYGTGNPSGAYPAGTVYFKYS